jgi:hypothetical protein
MTLIKKTLFINSFVEGYDIILFLLDKPIDEFTDEIQPACLPFNQSSIDYPPPDSTSLISGWGQTNGTDDNSLANDLQNALNKVVDCKVVYTQSITTSIICSCIVRKKLNFCKNYSIPVILYFLLLIYLNKISIIKKKSIIT